MTINEEPRPRWLGLNYAAAIFTSAFLLFQIQPLISKYILPWFGGSPAVWTTCLLFFQTLLFGGYAYAHYSSSRLRPSHQGLVHIALLIAAAAVALLFTLPGSTWEPVGSVEPIARIILILAASVGLPYFVLSATGPLLQAWFTRSFPGRPPYRLYALSNVGSLLALLSYPFLFEPALNIPQQAHFWAVGFAVFALLCGYAAWSVQKVSGFGGQVSVANDDSATASHQPPAPSPQAPTVLQRLLWLAWPMLGSVALLATTNRVTTDIAVMPFLWIVPLALYLLTFIIAFDRPQWYRRTLIAVLTVVSIYAAGVAHNVGVSSFKLYRQGNIGTFLKDRTSVGSGPELKLNTTEFLLINFLALFAVCMLAHGELVRLRPHPKYLTAFYLNIAAGGALGGIFVTLLAPHLFSTFLEWQIALAIAFLCAVGIILGWLVNFLVGLDETSPAPSHAAPDNRHNSRTATRVASRGGLALLIILPLCVMLLDLVDFFQPPHGDALLRSRNFFGTLAVLQDDADNPLQHNVYLKHGAILHGAQFTHPSRRREPTSYYTRSSGVARAIDYYRRELQDTPLKLGVVGLGAGTLAAYADGGDQVVFYDINPAVIDIAENGNWFTFLADARQRGAHVETRLGDARLTMRHELEQNHPQKFHVLALDAFSGDAIPVHLLTAEAFDLYLAHLAAGELASATGSESANSASATVPDQPGAIAVHISNRHIDLRPVVTAIAQRYGMHVIDIDSDNVSDDKQKAYNDQHLIYHAQWMILTHNDRLADELSFFATQDKAVEPILWTDAHSSLFKVLK